MKVEIVWVPSSQADTRDTNGIVLAMHGVSIYTLQRDDATQLKIGEKLELEFDELASAVGDDVFMGFPLTMQSHGKFVENNEKVFFELSKDVAPERQTYLKAICDLMMRVGEFKKFYIGTERAFIFSLGETPDSNVDLIHLGALVSEYNWKFLHENKALAQYEARNFQRSLQMSGAAANARKGRLTRQKIERIAIRIVSAEPRLGVNMSKLAAEIYDAEDAPVHSNGETKLKVDTLRGHLNKMRDNGFFENLT